MASEEKDTSGPDDRDSKGIAARLSAIRNTADTRFVKDACLPFGRSEAQRAADGRIARLFDAAAPFADTGFTRFPSADGGAEAQRMPGKAETAKCVEQRVGPWESP